MINKNLMLVAMLSMGTALTTLGKLKPALASLTPPATYAYSYTWNAAASEQYFNANGVNSIPLYTRIVDGIYFNYLNTLNIIDGFVVTQRFNRSNTTWESSGMFYKPDENRIGSNSSVGSISQKFDFTFDKSLALDTLYMEQLQLRVSFSNNPFGSDLSLNDGASPTPASLGIASWGAASAIFHYYDLDPDVTSELRKNVYASSDAHAFLTNGWYNYSAISSAGPVNLNSQNLVKHIFYIVQTRNGALSTPTGSHTLTAGGQTLQQHESQSDAMIQRLVFAPKQNVFGNALGEVIGCFDLTNAQHTESDSYSGGISLRNIADPRLTCSSLTSARYFVVECYYNLVSVSSASGQVMVAATS